jgi:hypothetical protein
MTAFSKALAAPPPKLGAIGGAVARSKTLKKNSGMGDRAAGGKKGDKATVRVSEVRLALAWVHAEGDRHTARQ